MDKPVKCDASGKPEVKGSPLQRLWDAVREPRTPDPAELAYVTDLMDRSEVEDFEASLGGLNNLRGELHEERARLREARKIERILVWKKILRETCEKLRAQFIETLDGASRRAFQIPDFDHGGVVRADCSCATTQGDEVAFEDRQFAFAVRMTPQKAQYRVRVMVEIKDTLLDGEQVLLRWDPDGASEVMALKRPTNRSTVVKAEFFLTSDQARAAKEGGIKVELHEP